MNNNEYFFQFDVSEEQVEYAKNLVEYSIKNHSVTDIFKNDPGGKERQFEFRLTGTLGEIVFADAYNLNRPKRSFGAVDGQDNGCDFLVNINGNNISFDIKSMSRKNNFFKGNYVLNLPGYQMQKDTTITDCYFCISLHKDFKNNFVASFIGQVFKQDIVNGKIGILYKTGSKRIKDNGDFFIFQRDTYEIEFKDISSPYINDKIKNLPGFKFRKI